MAETNLSEKSSALVYLCASAPSADELARLAAFRNQNPTVTLLVLELDGCNFPWAGHCDRRVAPGLGMQHHEVAAAMGMQLCLNEEHETAGVIISISDSELSAAARCLDLLAAQQTDAIILTRENGSSSLFVSVRAAFASSFWAALAERLSGVRLDILAQIFKISGRQLSVLEMRTGRLLHVAPSPAGMTVLSAHAVEVARVLGMRIGKFAPPRSGPVRKVAVITPYYKEPDAELTRCLDSVRDQSHPCDHFMVSDGFPNPLARRPGVHHIELGVSHGDNGNTPRYVGGLAALARGYDAIAYLDADNWFEQHHIKRLVETQHASGANATCSLRNIYLPDGHKVPRIDPEDVRKLHVDTSCYLLTRDCEYAIHLWGQMPRSWGPVCDRVAYSALLGMRLEWSGNRTLNFKSNYAVNFKAAGRTIPDKVNDIPTELWTDFAAPDEDFRRESISRTARLFRIAYPYRRTPPKRTS